MNSIELQKIYKKMEDLMKKLSHEKEPQKHNKLTAQLLSLAYKVGDAAYSVK